MNEKIKIKREDLLELYEERAGILEFDAGYSRRLASMMAREQIFEMYEIIRS